MFPLCLFPCSGPEISFSSSLPSVTFLICLVKKSNRQIKEWRFSIHVFLWIINTVVKTWHQRYELLLCPRVQQKKKVVLHCYCHVSGKSPKSKSPSYGKAQSQQVCKLSVIGSNQPFHIESFFFLKGQISSDFSNACFYMTRLIFKKDFRLLHE